MVAAAPLTSGHRAYYLPHHAVVKSSDSTGKIRVVFNASARTTTGFSLNDCLLTGSKLQEELWLVLSQWRMFKFAFTADIVQMFRQIKVLPADHDLQPPYLATKTLKQLAHDERKKFPIGSAALLKNTYVDDIHYGGDDLQQAVNAREQLISILAAGGLHLSKWAANHDSLCPAVKQKLERLFTESDGSSTLGLLWSAKKDAFSLRVTPVCKLEGCTKRSILSDVSRFFDTLGWAAPVLVLRKIVIQDLWKAGLSWDALLSAALQDRWMEFASTLKELERVEIPRFLSCSTTHSSVQLVGFSDASDRAFGAAVYLRSFYKGQTYVNLIMAKSKVAPIVTTSIPRLELCGALLVAKLIKSVADGLNLRNSPWYLWTDAKVILNWISSHPSRWPPYVAHRVAAIQEIAPIKQWNYVPSEEIPADLCTRGISPADLALSALWWHGPTWLVQPLSEWPNFSCPTANVDQNETEIRALHTAKPVVKQKIILERFSTYTRLVRATAFCLRFTHNARIPSAAKHKRAVGFLSTEELQASRLACIRAAQLQYFSEELVALRKSRPISLRSRLLQLRPFLDNDGVIRVGGRLHNTELPSDRRHPPVLAKDSHLSVLLLRYAHAQSLHGGARLMCSILSNVWIIHVHSLARRIARQCVTCTRFRAINVHQQQGQLPSKRVRPSRPFQKSGVDYAGPFRLTAYRGRGKTAYKGYVCLFICLATKAIHLELETDLTSIAFISAFKRFVSRRGHCLKLLSDNATNFRGADHELRTMMQDATKFHKATSELLAYLGTCWSFIPLSAPHFGGLWEAGVKSVKHHLRRTIGDQLLSYEEMATLLCQIEACLNSRPLHPASDDPLDLRALTPGHFLIGEPPINIPERMFEDVAERHPLFRWHQLSRLRDSFWRRWSCDYMKYLQTMQKWPRITPNLTMGSLVLIRNELQPPARWLLGRVIELHPGTDDLVRVVTLRTVQGTIQRPVTKLCCLPVDVVSPTTHDKQS